LLLQPGILAAQSALLTLQSLHLALQSLDLAIFVGERVVRTVRERWWISAFGHAPVMPNLRDKYEGRNRGRAAVTR